jgi:hypothetical protein
MPFQSSVLTNQGFGLVGELSFEGPLRAQPGVINSATPANNIVGRAFTRRVADGLYEAGAVTSATQVFMGILCSPIAQANYGTAAGGPLASSLTVPNGTVGEFMEMGYIVIQVPSSCNIGDEVCFTNATGALLTVAPGAAAGAGNTKIANCVITRVVTDAVGVQLAVAKITQ